VITDKNLQFSIKGLFFDKDQGEIEPVVSPPVMPMCD